MTLIILTLLIFYSSGEIFSFSLPSLKKGQIQLNEFSYGGSGFFEITIQKNSKESIVEDAGFVLAPKKNITSNLCKNSLYKSNNEIFHYFPLNEGNFYCDVKDPNTYQLYYVSCIENDVKGYTVRVKQHYEYSNEIHYLSFGEIPVVKIISVFVCVFLIALMIYVILLYLREYHSLQMVILTYVIIVFLNLIIETISLVITDIVGQTKFRYLLYILRLAQTVGFYVTTILVATGWSLKSKFDFNQKKLLLFFVILQFLSNMLYIIAEENEIVRYHILVVLKGIDVICGICILFPVIQTLAQLKKIAPSNVLELKQYKRFSTYYSLLLFITYFRLLLIYILEQDESGFNAYIYISMDRGLILLYAMYLMYSFAPKKKEKSKGHLVGTELQSSEKEYGTNEEKQEEQTNNLRVEIE
ncbi:Membrane-spanning protein [Entamoeba marina]